MGFIFKKLPREDDSKVSKQTKSVSPSFLPLYISQINICTIGLIVLCELQKKPVSPLAGAMGRDAEEPFEEDIGKAGMHL